MNTPKLTKEQAAIISAYTGYVAGPFSETLEYVERVMGRPIFTHELADPIAQQEIHEKVKVDFVSICREVEECPVR